MSIGGLPRPARTFLLNVRYALRWRKPMLTLRLVRRVLETRLGHARPLRYVEFSITAACNLRCPHCFATAFAPPPATDWLTPADYARVAGQAMALGAVNFSFQGGEPLLEPRLEQIVAACRPRHNLISVTTNGSLLDEGRLRRLRRLGVDILTVSLDSGIAAEHDRFRGQKGLFAAAWAGIERARRLGLQVTVGATVSRENLGSPGLEALIRLTAENRLILMLSLAAPIGRWQGRQDLVLTPEQVTALRERCRASTYLRTDFDANFAGAGCGAVKEILYVSQTGEVLPCPFIHIALGNVRCDDLATIRARSLELGWFRPFYPRCLCGEDPEFMKSVLAPAATLPAPVDRSFWHDHAGPRP